jgi:hypothetical protein
VTRRRVLSLAAVLALAATGIGYAAVTGGGAVYHACVSKGEGQLRLIDPTLGSSSNLQHCKSNETEISWNEQGQPGPQGLQGAQGPPGPSGLARFAGTSCPAGESVTGFDATGAIICSSGSASGGGGGTVDTDHDGIPDDQDRCPQRVDVVVSGVAYCPATTYEANTGAVIGPLELVGPQVVAVGGATFTVAAEPGDPAYDGDAGSTLVVALGGLAAPPLGSRVTILVTPQSGGGYVAAQITVTSP